MATQTDVTILLKLKDQLSKELDKTGANVEKASKKFGDLGKVIGTGLKVACGVGVVALGGLTAGFVKAVTSASESQKEMEIVFGTLKNTAKETGLSFDDLKEKTLSLSQDMLKLGYDDEETAKSFARLTQVTKDTALGQEFLTTTMDLARAKQLDLDTATTQMILAMQGSGRVLKQFGIDVEDGATKTEILSAVQQKVSGQAEAFANTFAGSQERMKVAVGNLWEQIGMYLLPAVTELATKFSDLIMRFQTSGVIDQVANKVSQLWNRLTELWALLVEKLKPDWDKMIMSIQIMFKELGLLEVNWKDVGKYLGGTIVLILKTVTILIKLLADEITRLRPAIQLFIDGWTAIFNILSKVVEVMKKVVEWSRKLPSKISTSFGGSGGGGSYATGGLVTPSRSYLVGERGAEIFQPMTTGKIIPNNQLQSSGGNPITLNVNVGMYAGTETEKRNIAESLYKGLVQLAGMQNKSVAELLGA